MIYRHILNSGALVLFDKNRREFGPIDGAVAVDQNERFAVWKLGITQSVAIKPAEVWELLDGIVVY